jgi:hypothetical protein
MLSYKDRTLLLPVTIEHIIDERSPLFGHTQQSLRAINAEIVVVFEGATELGEGWASHARLGAVEVSYLDSDVHMVIRSPVAAVWWAIPASAALAAPASLLTAPHCPDVPFPLVLLPSPPGDQFHARQSYLPEEIHWGHVFANIIRPAAPGLSKHTVDLSRWAAGHVACSCQQGMPAAFSCPAHKHTCCSAAPT